MTRSRMTPKQRVLKKYPKAGIYRWSAGDVCLLHDCNELPYGRICLAHHLNSPTKAWADAARRLRRG